MVAQEIGNLASNSSATARQISDICAEINSNIANVQGCVDDIIGFMEGDNIQYLLRHLVDTGKGLEVQHCRLDIGTVLPDLHFRLLQGTACHMLHLFRRPDLIGFMEGDVSRKFQEFADIANEYGNSVAAIRSTIGEIEESSNGFVDSVESIRNRMDVIQSASQENEVGVGDIVKKIENTSNMVEELLNRDFKGET